jgi:hypothetical protein
MCKENARAVFAIVCVAFLSMASFAKAEDKLPDSLFLKESPATAENVGELKKKAKEGEEIVVRGQIGGQAKDVFNAGRAVMMLADMKLVSCDKTPGETCATPWDFCCVPINEKSANIAIIQVVDAKGKLVKSTLKGANGLDHLTTVVIKGKVSKNEGGNLIINASGIYIEPKSAAKPAEPAPK